MLLNLQRGRYTIKLDSDEVQFGGHGRLDHATEFFTQPHGFNGCANSMQVKHFLLLHSFSPLGVWKRGEMVSLSLSMPMCSVKYVGFTLKVSKGSTFQSQRVKLCSFKRLNFPVSKG